MNKSLILTGLSPRGEPEWVVWLTVMLALGAGLVFTGFATNQVTTLTASGNTITVPASWDRTHESDTLLSASNLSNDGIFAPRIAVRQVAKQDLTRNPSSTLADAATAWSLQRGSDLVGYSILALTPVSVQGRAAIQIEYAYLLDSPQGAGSGTMPALMHAVDTILLVGDQYEILTFAAQKEIFAQLTDLRSQMLDSWHVQ